MIDAIGERPQCLEERDAGHAEGHGGQIGRGTPGDLLGHRHQAKYRHHHQPQ
jgi:hypothetical protein